MSVIWLQCKQQEQPEGGRAARSSAAHAWPQLSPHERQHRGLATARRASPPARDAAGWQPSSSGHARRSRRSRRSSHSRRSRHSRTHSHAEHAAQRHGPSQSAPHRQVGELGLAIRACHIACTESSHQPVAPRKGAPCATDPRLFLTACTQHERGAAAHPHPQDHQARQDALLCAGERCCPSVEAGIAAIARSPLCALLVLVASPSAAARRSWHVCQTGPQSN